MKRWWLPLAAVLAVVLVATVVIATRWREQGGSPTGVTALVARIVDEQGSALAHTEVRFGPAGTVRTDGNGGVRVPLQSGPQLVSVVAADRVPRTQAVVPGTPTEIVLTSDPDATVTMRFGGDVMFGRRFYDVDDDGDRRDGLLDDRASAADHTALLAEVRPLVQDADVTVVNFETPLAEQPWIDPTQPRPSGFHPTKDYVFASSPVSVQALVETGVDVVSLGNNHLYDALEPGLDTTLATLDAAGVARFGAGRTVDEAWQPAVIERKGQRLAFLGCTTITGTEHPIAYVAGEGQGGAARCSAERLEREVRAARARADVVVVMIHGGEEYDADQTELVRGLSAVASSAGAALVVNGHPHVVGGVSLDDGALTAETLGNLLFDQTVWPTFLSYLLRVDLRAGRPVHAGVDPLFIDGYVPRPTVGVLADAAARRAAAGPTGDPEVRLQPPGAVLAAAEAAPPAAVERTFASGTVARLAPGWWVQGPAQGVPDSSVRSGEDLLWTGSFEDMDTDPGTDGAHGWALSPTATLTSAAACTGAVGVQLDRSPVSTEDVLATPAHRQLVTPGAELSLVAEVRDASPGATLELRWYPDTRGGSTSVTTLRVPEGSSDAGSCRQVRIDATVPEGIVAVQPMIRLSPTLDVHLGARLAVDDVQLIAWAASGEHGRRLPVVDVRDDATLVLRDDTVLPGDPVAHQSTSP